MTVKQFSYFTVFVMLSFVFAIAVPASSFAVALPEESIANKIDSNESLNDGSNAELALTPLELAVSLREDLLRQDLKDIYEEITKLEEVAENQNGEAKYETLVMVLDYYFWIDSAEGIRQTVDKIKLMDFSNHAEAASRDIFNKLYLGYADVVDDAEHTKAVEVFSALLSESFVVEDKYNQSIAYEMLGTADALFGKYYTSLEKLQLALEMLSGIDNMKADRIRVGIYLAYAYVYTSLDNSEKAIDFYRRAVSLSQKHGFAVDHGGIIYNVGFLLLQNRDLEVAEEFFFDLEKRYLEVGDPFNLIFPYYALAFINYYKLEYATALEFAEKSYLDGDTIVDYKGTLLQLMAELNARLGNLDRSYQLLGEAEEYFEEYPDYKGTVWEASMLKVQAVIAHVEGRHDDAMKKYEEFYQAFAKAQNDSFTKDFDELAENLLSRINNQQTEIALKQINLKNQRYLSAFITFLLIIMVGLILFQLRWSKILRLSKLDAEQASRSKSEFLAQMSHELRTPLNAIIGFSEMMSKGVLGELNNKKYKDYVVLINQSGLHLLRIINDILDISKVESGKLELRESKFDLCELIDETVEIMQNRASKAGLAIENTAPEKCSLLYADRRIVKQIMFNIISNSVKFTAKGGSIDISYRVLDGGDVIIEIVDTGHGMSPEHLQQAMEPFGQVKQVLVQSHEGTGLGLPLVKAFMELHQGSINISSKLGEGTRVELIFPSERVS